MVKPLGALALLAGAALPAAELADTTPACLKSWPEVRYRSYGYDHIVHIANECRVVAVCAVSSDVNRMPIEVTIAAFDQIEVLLSRGSPAREFTPRLDCRFVTAR